jgi:hypothetical protein
MPLKGFNSWMKLKILWKMLSNGLPKKLLWQTKIWDQLELILWMLSFMLMLFIEEVVNLFLPLEESIMVVNWLLAHLYKNLFSKLKLPLHLILWEESIMFSIKEEVLLSKKNKSKELQLTLLEPTYLSLNLSDSPLL